MLKRYAEELQADGFCDSFDAEFFAKQNAKVVKDAEEYYRAMFTRDRDTWNMRDSHMVSTLKDIMEHLDIVNGHRTRAVIWAHNSHLGDAGYTDNLHRGKTNIGQLVRMSLGLENTYNIGFTSFHGTVAAADNWNEDVKIKRVKHGMEGSWERLFHEVGIPSFLLVFRTNDSRAPISSPMVNKALSQKPLLERAIGVVYRPMTERQSHYTRADLPNQFDTVIHIDRTFAVKPLDEVSALNIEEHEEETYPSGL
jgi:erythromycin esterase-like protein